MQRQINIRGARAGTLAGVDMDLGIGQVHCFTGRSRNGRRSMALEVIYGESRRRYMQALAPAEREGLQGISRVDVDEISGLPPAIHLGAQRSGRSLGDYLQIESALIQLCLQHGQVYCQHCGGPCRGYAADQVEAAAAKRFGDERCLILAPLELQADVKWSGVWQQLQQAGFLRVKVGGQVLRLDEGAPEVPGAAGPVQVVVDRLVPATATSVRFLEAVRTSRSISSGQTIVEAGGSGETATFNHRPTCEHCGLQHDEFADVDLMGGGPGADLVKIAGKTVRQLRGMPLEQLRTFAGDEFAAGYVQEQMRAVLDEGCVFGLGHLPLARRMADLADGEWQRLQLVACLCGGLTGILYLFEGLGDCLQPALAEVAAQGLKRLVGRGNTAVLLEHNPLLLRGADTVWEFASGTPREIDFRDKPRKSLAIGGHSDGRPALALRGTGDRGPVDCQLLHGAFNCLTGPSGSGKSQLLSEVLAPALKGRKVLCECSGLPRNPRVVEMNDRGKRSTLLAELGGFAAVAEIYAEAPAAKARGWGRDAFMLDKPGGRCTRCEGLGYQYFDMEFLEDISLQCEACDGRKFRDEILEITVRGFSIADILSMTMDRAASHFARVQKLRTRLEAALKCGLGYLPLGHGVQDLEAGEGLRLQLAMEIARALPRSWIIIDQPSRGDHPEDIAVTVGAIRDLVERGATVVVADQHRALLEAADWVVEIGGINPEVSIP